MANIGVIGTGIWGTALALTAARAGNHVICWAREDDVVASINQRGINERFLPEIPLPEAIKATDSLQDVLQQAEFVLMTVSAQHTRSVLEQMKPFVRKGNCLILCAKGIETDTGLLLSEVAQQILPGVRLAILAGPSFAREVALGKPTAVTIACAEKETADTLSKMMSTRTFRPYTTADIISPQIGGSLKNVMAIASGIVEGAGFGDDARAALITRGLNEMTRLAKALNGHLRTMIGMCGLGDLILTATCTQSRNFSFGFEVGQRLSAKELLAENTKTVEGIHTAPAVLKRAKELNIEMPICTAVYQILFEGLSIPNAMQELLTRPLKDEGI